MREIPGYVGYMAGDDGSIVSVRSGSPVRLTSRMHKGYPHVTLRAEGVAYRVKRPVHGLVVLAYSGPKPFPDAECRHLDGDPTNSTPGNLAWGTRAENAADSVRHGTAIWLRRGEAHPRTRLKWVDVQAIREACDDGASYRSTAKAFRIDPQWVSRIHRGTARREA